MNGEVTICEICGEQIFYFVTSKTKNNPPRACKGHCALVLEQREGRVAAKNWRVIKDERKGA